MYVYGVVRRRAVRSLPRDGVAGAPVELVEAGDLAAVVSPLPNETLRARRRDLHRHLRVLEEVFGVTTVVPCAFGAVLPSEAVVTTELLAGRRDELVEMLARLAGHAQLNVKASYDEDAVLREIVATEPEIARLQERTRALGDAAYYDSIRLGELVAAALEIRRARDAGRILKRLAPIAAEVMVEDPDGDAALKASFLVARTRLKQFDAGLDGLANELAPSLRFESFGPLPATAFATLDERG